MPSLHRITIFAIFAALFLTLPVFSGNPPPLPKIAPPLPIIPPGATSRHFPELPPTNIPLDPKTVRTESVSSSPYYSTLLYLGLLNSASTTSTNAFTVAANPAAPLGGQRLHTASTSLSMRTLASGIVGQSWNFTNPPNEQHQQVEPTIYAQGFAPGMPTTVVLSQRQTPPVTGNLYSSQTFDFANFSSGYLPMPIPANGQTFQQTADPWLAGNPYTIGLHPGWVYASGVAFQRALNEIPNAIVLWHSTDGGRTWSTPTEAGNNIIVNRNTAYFYDKPAMAINTNTNFLGNVYVAFTKVYLGNNNLSILSIARSRDGQTFDPTLDIADIAQGNLTGAQVVVDNTSGIIYVIYVDMTSRQVRMASVVDNNSFQPLWVMSTENVTGIRPGIINRSDPALNGGVTAWSLPSAVFFWPTGRICVAWHEHAAQGTDIFFTSKTPNGAWPANPVQLTNEINDQFMPAMDYDSNDNTLVVGYYDRSYDAGNNISYENTLVVTNDSGSTILSGPTSMTPGVMYDPTVMPLVSGELGDYQGIFGWNFPGGPRHNSIYIRAGSTWAVDAWATGIQ